MPLMYSSIHAAPEGKELKLVAIQPSMRTRNKKATTKIYHLTGTNKIYHKMDGSNEYAPMGYDATTMQRYYDVFVRPPLTSSEKQWLEIYNYILVEDERPAGEATIATQD